MVTLILIFGEPSVPARAFDSFLFSSVLKGHCSFPCLPPPRPQQDPQPAAN